MTAAPLISFLGHARKLEPRQWVKITVYTLLLLNFAHYLAQDLERAAVAARSDWGLLDWTGAFATTLDELAWFALLFLFELETYLLEDSAFTRARVLLMHGLRLLCCLVIVHTLWSYWDYAAALAGVEPSASTDLCELVAPQRWFSYNLSYEILDAASCSGIATQGPLYLFEGGALVTDARGMRVEWELALVDVVEAATWLFIVLLLELLVRLQNRDITGGWLLRSAVVLKVVAYAVLWVAAAYWAYRGHWMFAWDETLWILGFVAIGANLKAWRQELEQEQEQEAD